MAIKWRNYSGTSIGVETEVSDTNPMPVSIDSIAPGGGLATETKQDDQINLVKGSVSTGNSSSTPLGSNATFTGTWTNILDYSEVIVGVIATGADSKTDGLKIQWSSDGVNVHDSDVFTAYDGDSTSLTFPCHRKYCRVIYENDGGAQTTFNLETVLKRYASKGSSHRLKDDLAPQDDGIVTKSLVVGYSPSGGPDGSMVNIRSKSNGSLQIALSDISDVVGQNTAANSLPVVLASNSALPTGTNLIGQTISNNQVGTSFIGTASQAISQAFINVAASQTDSILVAGSLGKVIYVLSLAMVTNGTATNVTFNSKGGGAGVAISPLFANAANGGAVLSYNPGVWFKTVSGEALTVTTGTGSTTGVLISYIQV